MEDLQVYTAESFLALTTAIHKDLLDIESRSTFGTPEHTELFKGVATKHGLM